MKYGSYNIPEAVTKFAEADNAHGIINRLEIGFVIDRMNLQQTLHMHELEYVFEECPFKYSSQLAVQLQHGFF